MARTSFCERMDDGKANAMERRNRGQHTGKVAKGWNVRRPALIGLDRLEWEFTSWRKEWQYQCLAAVETALFAHEWEGPMKHTAGRSRQTVGAGAHAAR